MRKTLVALAVWLLALPAGAAPHPYLDLDFEAPECTADWWTIDQGFFETLVDRSDSYTGSQSLRVRYRSTDPWNQNSGFDGMGENFPAAEVAGKRVRYSAAIRTEGITSGAADLWWVVDNAAGDTIAFGSLGNQAARGTTPWTRYSFEVDVPAEAAEVAFGAILQGNGTAWFDDIKVEIDGVPWAEGPQTAKPVVPAAVSWLRRQAIRVKTEQPESGFADLQRLKPLIGKARVVSLGEATHGTREFFQMKHRLLEFLASEMGFTYFGIEANMPEAERINRYVLTGEGDPRKLLQGMYFWTWNTQEVLDMILWMRELNRSGRGRVQFVGFDMQYMKVAAPNVLDFLRRADPGYVSEAERAFARLLPLDTSYGGTAEDAAVARAVYDHLAGRRADYLAGFPREEVDWAIQNARIVLQEVENQARITFRDESMAKNVEWILEQAPPGSKIVLWAHNLHVAKRGEGYMGDYLFQRFGRDMVVLGFAFGEGRYSAYGSEGLRDYEAAPPTPGSVEAHLRATGLPRLIVDLRRVQGGAPATLFKQPKPFRNVGSVAVRCGYVATPVAQLFDGLIWFDQTHPSVLLPFD